jgi:hypothetical protein
VFAEDSEVVAAEEFVGGQHRDEFSAWAVLLEVSWMGRRERASSPFAAIVFLFMLVS